MMEENNRKGPGIFYAVVGVATLVVAIIGATFAYFSAAASATGDEITGGTNTDLASALSVKVTRVAYEGTTAPSLNLVPAELDDTTPAGVTAAVSAKCENNGYTGCHVYRIDANTTQNVNAASILLDLEVTGDNTKDNWKYLVYKGTESSATSITTAATSLKTKASQVDLHAGAALAAGTVDTAPSVTYYLVVYLANVDAPQNTTENGGTVETGTYTGTITMNAAGGEVKATFTASA